MGFGVSGSGFKVQGSGFRGLSGSGLSWFSLLGVLFGFQLLRLRLQRLLGFQGFGQTDPRKFPELAEDAHRKALNPKP